MTHQAIITEAHVLITITQVLIITNTSLDYDNKPLYTPIQDPITVLAWA